MHTMSKSTYKKNKDIKTKKVSCGKAKKSHNSNKYKHLKLFLCMYISDMEKQVIYQ